MAPSEPVRRQPAPPPVSPWPLQHLPWLPLFPLVPPAPPRCGENRSREVDGKDPESFVEPTEELGLEVKSVLQETEQLVNSQPAGRGPQMRWMETCPGLNKRCHWCCPGQGNNQESGLGQSQLDHLPCLLERALLAGLTDGTQGWAKGQRWGLAALCGACKERGRSCTSALMHAQEGLAGHGGALRPN